MRKIDKLKKSHEEGKNTVRVQADIIDIDYNETKIIMNGIGIRNESTYISMALKKHNQLPEHRVIIEQHNRNILLNKAFIENMKEN